jgi:hypothetical protein
MHRPARGGTTHPPSSRPGMGYGRPVRANPRGLRPASITAELDALLAGHDVPVADIEVLADRSSVTASDPRG